MSAIKPKDFLGLTLVATFLDTYLYGLISCQYMKYYSSKFKDSLWIRAVVFSLFILDTTQTISVVWMMYNYCVTHFTEVAYLSQFTIDRFWPFTWSIMSNSINALLTQCVLTYRLYRLTGNNRFVAGGFISLALASWAVCTFSQIKALQFATQVTFIFEQLEEINKVFAASRIMDLIEDISLTVSLIFVLRRARTGFERTDSIINTILLGAIRTGFFCMTMSLVSAIIFFTPSLQDVQVFNLFALTQGKVSTNVLLDSLLRRSEFKKGESSAQASSYFQAQTQGQGAPTNTIELRVRKDIQTQVTADDGEYLPQNAKRTDKDSASDGFSLKGKMDSAV